MKKYSIPEWLSELLPEPREPNVISFENGVYTVTDPNGETSETFENLEKAYDSIDDSTLTLFDESVPDDNMDRMMYSVPHGKSNHTRALFSNTEAEKIKDLEKTFNNWVKEGFKKYLNSPDDFMKSYRFLNNHPALWSNPKIGTVKDPFFWSTDQGIKSLRIDPYAEEGEVVFYGEMGARVLPEADHHYHDYRLDTTAKSYEELIIKMARALNEAYYEDGMEKPEAP
jgi:hypothetical protein